MVTKMERKIGLTPISQIRKIRILKVEILPHYKIFMERKVGLAPTTRIRKIRILELKYSRMYMEAPTGFEPVIEVLQTSALPLGYGALKAGLAGFEPTSDGVKVRCLTAWL